MTSTLTRLLSEADAQDRDLHLAEECTFIFEQSALNEVRMMAMRHILGPAGTPEDQNTLTDMALRAYKVDRKAIVVKAFEKVLKEIKGEVHV